MLDPTLEMQICALMGARFRGLANFETVPTIYVESVMGVACRRGCVFSEVSHLDLSQTEVKVKRKRFLVDGDDMESFSNFNAVLLNISDQLSEEQIVKLKHLCQHLIGKRSLEMIDSGIKLFQVLRERRKLAPDDTEFLCDLLTSIKREDLVHILTTSGSTAALPDNPENGTVDTGGDLM